MALDRQKILGELGSVMKQLQSADCGCLGKLFGSPQQPTAQPIGNPLPTCGGCRHTCCHGHGYSHYNSNNQPSHNMDYNNMAMSDKNSFPPPTSSNMYGYGPQIANMMRSSPGKLQNIPEQGQLTGPLVIDAPQSPHGKVGLTPFTPGALSQQGHFNVPSMNHGDFTGQNIAKPVSHHTPNTHGNIHGQHSEGIAKFNQMFPGVKQGMGGELGFDPMAIAIQMNPDNRLQTALDTMNKVMNENTGMNKVVNNIPMSQPTAQPIAGENLNVPSNSPVPNNMLQGNLVPGQITQNQAANQLMPVNQNALTPNQIAANPQNTANQFGQPIPQQNQQMYAANVDQSLTNQQVLQNDNHNLLADQQYQRLQQQTIAADAPNLPTAQEEYVENYQTPGQQMIYSNEPLQQIIKEPIYPADNSRNMYVPSKQQKSYEYNTLGQPIEMLPAKLYHPKEPGLPQTLSPQPIPAKSRSVPLKAINVKATISKTSIMGNKPAGRTPSRSQLQQIYNQYKGSQSFTQQSLRNTSEPTHSDGRLNVPRANITKPSIAPMERVGGDTAVSNLPCDRPQTIKENNGMDGIGDVPVAKSAGDAAHPKAAPEPIKKCRNGLQDMVFSSYPTSTAWSFHGHGRNDLTQPHRYRNRNY